MEVRVEKAQPDMDTFDLYDDMRRRYDRVYRLMTHPRDAIEHSFLHPVSATV